MKRAFLGLALLLPLLTAPVACAIDDHDHDGRRHKRRHDESVTSYAPSESASAPTGQPGSARSAATPQVGAADSGADLDASDAAPTPEEPAEAGEE